MTVRNIFYRGNGKIEKGKKSVKMREALTLLYLPLSLLFMEVTAKIKVFDKLLDGEFHYLLLLSLSLGFLLSAFSMLFPGKARRIFMKTVLAVTAVWFSFHITYFSNFHAFFSWQTLGQAADVTQFWKEALLAAAGVWYMILAFFVPLVIFCALDILLVPDSAERSLSYALLPLALYMVFHGTGMLWVAWDSRSGEGETPYYYYTYLQSDMEQSFRHYGILNVTGIDIRQLIFGAPDEKLDIPFGERDVEIVSDADKGWNMLAIDFDRAAASTESEKLAELDRYFQSLTPTAKNDYTGMFAGKNLIFITLEGFSDKVIDPEFTPLLYKMATEGFVFKNFYNTTWGGSTASGEYANMTGNLFLTANCLKLSAKTYQPFALGNQFKKLGYNTLAYHNNTYTYYDRHQSHPNFGYTWKAVGNGLELKEIHWPNSDEEMAQLTAGDYLDSDKPFHAYYMSFSGHAGYFFAGNMMSKRHKSDLLPKHQAYSATIQAYFACQYEVELMLRELVNRVEQAGRLEDTVFAFTADHYPYPLNDNCLSELYGLPKSRIRENFDLYRNCFVLWSASMEHPIEVDTPCSTIDILPTISNLFGLPYDARLMTGTDILGDGEHFALLKVDGWSWVSALGSYRGTRRKFSPSADCTLSQEETEKYVKQMNQRIKAKTTYSPQILKVDYYRHIFPFIENQP